jgi:transcriptional regulator with XRE-family HTH domain
MGQTQGGRRAPLGELIAAERQRRGLTRAELAALVRRADRTLHTDDSQVKRWERGQEPQPAALRALAVALGRQVEELTALLHELPPGDAYELLAVIDDSDIGSGVVSDLEDAVLRLRRSYSTTPPQVLAGQLDARLGTVRRLLRGHLTLAQRRDLMALAGWLALLQGTVWFDRASPEPAWSYRNAALHVAQELGHAELEAWAWETPAWFALMDGRFRDAAEFCQRGQAVAPRSSVLVALNAQEARARARLGQREETIAAVRRAEEIMEHIPVPEDLSDHYTFDPAKIDFYAATAFLALDEPERAEHHARNVIAASSGPGGPNYWPTRVGSARMDLGLALTQRHEIDLAAHEAGLAFGGPFVRRSTLVRARDLMTALARYRDVAEVRDFEERYQQAQAQTAR